jgi:tRNA U55 pseudouridine synthase TruB
VYSLELLSYDSSEKSGTFRIACSKGTYIRTLINDIGEALSCGGIMTSLVRTKACGFTLDDCTTFEELQKKADSDGINESILFPLEKLFSELPAICLYGAQERMYRNGVKLDINRIKYTEGSDRYCIYGNDKFLGTAYIDKEKGELRSEKNFFDERVIITIDLTGTNEVLSIKRRLRSDFLMDSLRTQSSYKTGCDIAGRYNCVERQFLHLKLIQLRQKARRN